MTLIRRILSGLITLALVIMMIPVTTLAWGDEGHRITALIGYKLLTQRARTNVLMVLEGTEMGDVQFGLMS